MKLEAILGPDLEGKRLSTLMVDNEPLRLQAFIEAGKVPQVGNAVVRSLTTRFTHPTQQCISADLFVVDRRVELVAKSASMQAGFFVCLRLSQLCDMGSTLEASFDTVIYHPSLLKSAELGSASSASSPQPAWPATQVGVNGLSMDSSALAKLSFTFDPVSMNARSMALQFSEHGCLPCIQSLLQPDDIQWFKNWIHQGTNELYHSSDGVTFDLDHISCRRTLHMCPWMIGGFGCQTPVSFNDLCLEHVSESDLEGDSGGFWVCLSLSNPAGSQDQPERRKPRKAQSSNSSVTSCASLSSVPEGKPTSGC